MKTIKPTLLAVFTAILFLLNHTDTKAQFEQKFTLQASGGYTNILWGDFYHLLDNGFTGDIGLQYNFSRRFSLVFLIKYGEVYVKSEPYSGWDGTAGWTADLDGDMFYSAFSLSPKYRFLTHRKVQPYVYVGPSFNALDCWVIYNIQEQDSPPSPPERYEDSFAEWTFGVNAGAGLDIGISDNIALFIQGGYNNMFFYASDYFIGENVRTGNHEEIDMILEWTYIQFGININIFKSRTL